MIVIYVSMIVFYVCVEHQTWLNGDFIVKVQPLPQGQDQTLIAV